MSAPAGDGAASRRNLLLPLIVIVNLSVSVGGVALSDGMPLSDAMREQATGYRAAVDALPMPAERAAGRRYEPMSLSGLTTDHDIGVIDLANLHELITHPSIGRPIALRGRLAYFDPEEMSPLAAPRSYRVFEIDEVAGNGTLRSVFLDVGALGAAERAVIDEFCGGLVPCDVEVSGRIDEVIAERRSNPFSATGAVTVTIGVVVENIDFIGETP